jgi:hypothetical protein
MVLTDVQWGGIGAPGRGLSPVPQDAAPPPPAHDGSDHLAVPERRQMVCCACRVWSLVDGSADLHSGAGVACGIACNLVQEKGGRLGMAFLDGSNIRAHQKAADAAKRGISSPTRCA